MGPVASLRCALITRSSGRGRSRAAFRNSKRSKNSSATASPPVARSGIRTPHDRATVVRIAFARAKKGRCRLHGGASDSGAPSGERNGQYAPLEDAKRIEFDCGAALEIFHLRVPSRLGRSRLIAEG